MKSLHPVDSILFEPNRDELSLNMTRYWQAVVNAKWRVVVTTLAVILVSFFVINSLTPQYKATATLLIERQESQVVPIESLEGLNGDSEEYLETEFAVLRSRLLAEKVVDTLELDAKPEFADSENAVSGIDIGDIKDRLINALGLVRGQASIGGNLADEEEIARRELLKEYSERISIFPIRKTQLVEISFESPSPVLARDVANAHAEAYIEADLEARRGRSREAASWLDEKVLRLSEDLDQSKIDLATFIQQENIVDINGDVTKIVSQELQDLVEQMAEVRSRFAEAQIARDQVRSAGVNRESLPLVQRDPLVQQIQLDVVAARQNKAELSKTYGPQHPRMLQADSDLNSASESLDSQIDKVIQTVELQYAAARAEVASLQRRIDAARSTFYDRNDQSAIHDQLTREVDSAQRLLDIFFDRTQEMTETFDLKRANARILTEAEVPLQHFKPRKTVLLVLAGLCGMLLSMAYYVLRELFNTGIRDEEDVGQRIGLPLLGLLPIVKKSWFRKSALDPTGNAKPSRQTTIFDEAVNTIRTGMVLNRAGESSNVVMVTSSVAGEGKSTIAAHLAGSYSKIGRTLLIDCDLRTAGASNMFDVRKSKSGLRELLGNDGIFPVKVKYNLEVLSANFKPENPLQFVSREDLKALIKRASNAYDYVIVDAPPVLPVSDSLVLAGYVDEIIFVIRARATPFKHINRCLQSLQRVNAPVSGVVLNQLDMDGAQYYYYRYGEDHAHELG